MSGAQGGFDINGAAVAGGCFASACTFMGFHITGILHLNGCGSFGNTIHGFAVNFGNIASTTDVTRMNGITFGWNCHQFQRRPAVLSDRDGSGQPESASDDL